MSQVASPGKLPHLTLLQKELGEMRVGVPYVLRQVRIDLRLDRLD